MKWREHGINATYQAGCRCEECREAHANAISEYRKGLHKKMVCGESTDRVDRMIALAFREKVA